MAITQKSIDRKNVLIYHYYLVSYIYWKIPSLPYFSSFLNEFPLLKIFVKTVYYVPWLSVKFNFLGIGVSYYPSKLILRILCSSGVINSPLKNSLVCYSWAESDGKQLNGLEGVNSEDFLLSIIFKFPLCFKFRPVGLL